MDSKFVKPMMYAAAVLGILVVGFLLKINYFEAGSALVTKYANVSSAMRLSVQGLDLRVYEFAPQETPNWNCVFVAGTNKASLFCIPRRAEEQSALPE